MSEIINLPTIIDGTVQQTSAKLVDIVEDKNILIKSLPYLPDFQRDAALFKDAALLLDALLQSKEEIEKELKELQQKYDEEGEGKTIDPVDWSLMDEIYTAYCDTLYKLPGYTNLSYEARVALIEENGFDYVLDLLYHMYDSDYAALEKKYQDGAISELPTYNEFIKTQSDNALTRLTSLFTIINILKGTTSGLELVFKILNVPDFLYITWDIIAKFKGSLTITDEEKFIPVPREGSLLTDTIEPTWGEKFVTDNNIIWRRTKATTEETWGPNKIVNYGDYIKVETPIQEYVYQAYKPEKGDVFLVSGENAQLQYIFNGVAWHVCTNYKAYETEREQFTAELTIGGLQGSSDFQSKIDNFVRYYMLPYIDVTLEFRQEAPFVYAFPSGYGILEVALLFANYIDEHGNTIHHNLSAKVNERWGISNQTEVKNLTLGKPIFNDLGFQGSFNLAKSFVQDTDGTRHPLYDKDYLTIPDAITGPARDKYNDKGEITNYDGDYLQVGLSPNGYADVDFYMEHHQNPTWSEDGTEFYRDTLIKIFRAITVYGVDHMSVAQLGQTKIKEFCEQIEEVYGGRSTSTVPTSVSVHCTTRTPWVREKTGTEGPYNLTFSDYEVSNTKYTGIGDIGILGSNEYFIYNGMLMKALNDDYMYIDGNDTWTDVGASNVNPEYMTPAIMGGMLKYIYNDQVYDLYRDNGTIGGYKTHYQIRAITVRGLEELQIDELSLLTLNSMSEYADMGYWSDIEYGGNWTHVTGFVNKNYTAYGICDGRLYKIYLKEGKAHYTMLDEDQQWTYVTGAFYYDTYKAYGIKNGVMYVIDDEITPLKYNNQILTGWDSSFDCISRYHHTNTLFTTYGICNGNLYSINGTDLELLDSNGWTAICGYYNEESPRTFGYGIKNGALYEIRKDQIVLVNDEMFWYDISGCSTTTKTYVLGLAKYYESETSGYIYKIKSGTCEKLIEEGGWTDVFGRYTTSTSANGNCFGYGIKDKKLYLLHRDMTEPITVSGNWKLDGQGEPVDLLDYDITNIYVIINGEVISGQNNVCRHVPIDENDDPHNYDIIVNYETVGFNDNTRYNIKTEHTFSQNTYVSPEEVRSGISLAHMNGEFNTTTGISNAFINCPVIIHGTRKINGYGEAYDFVNEQTYLELPNLGYYMVEFDYDGKHYGPYRFNMTNENIAFMVDNEFIYNIPQDPPEINSYVTRMLNGWDADLERDINYLLTIRDELSITVTTTQYPDTAQEINIQFGGVGSTRPFEPIILDKDFNTGIYFGQQQIAALDINGNYVKLYDLPTDDYLMPHVKFIKSGNNYIVHKSLDGTNYTNTNIKVKEPKFLGGDGTNFGDCIILLASSYMVGNLETINLYENGYYISVNTQGGPVIEELTTGENQEVQKVVEIQTENGNTVLELDMDTLYTSMEHETSNPDLTITDTYNLNKLNVGFHEGIDTATLTYSGEYYLDEEKANEIGDIGNYEITKKASNFSDANYLNINPENVDPLIITTGDNVNEQYLFDSEEDSVVTNKPLLTSELSGTYDGYNTMRLVNSGAEYELLTDQAQTVTRTLEYNAESFSIDYNKIYNIETFPYDSYRALLNFNGQEGSNVAATINIDLDGTILPDGSIDSLPILNFTSNTNHKRKVFEFDKNDILLGNVSLVEVPVTTWYTMDEEELVEMEDAPTYDEETDTYSYEGHVLTHDSDIFIDYVEYHVYKYEDSTYYLNESTETRELPDLNPVFEFNENGEDLCWKLNVKKTFHGVNETWMTEHNPQTDPKDKLIYNEGKVHNFSETNYFTLNEIKDTNGLVLCITTSDDTSINQGIFDCTGVGSLCIKNDRFYWIEANGTEHISEYIPAPNKEYSFAIRNLKVEGYDDGTYYGDVDYYDNRNKINVANIYITLDGLNWIPLFDSVEFRTNLTNVSEYIIGKSKVGNEYLPFLGIVDLTKSWVEQVNIAQEKIDQARLFLVTQITKFYISNNSNDWTLYETITTPYSVWNYTMGYEYTGSLDMYNSRLLINYDLGWVDSGIYLNTKVREELTAAGIPVGDTDVFDIEAYGIQLTETPQRWDRITVTYTTVDNAYYLRPNTKYYIKFRTNVDKESGKCLLENDGNATWNNGIISGLSNTDNYNTTLDCDYIVLKFKPSNITTLQGLCGYNVNNSKSIVIENKELKCFDDTNYHTLLTGLKTNKYYWIKLYTSNKPIEVSTDGETWEQTSVYLPFSNYAPFVVGNGYTTQGRKEFLGSLDLKDSYISTDEVVEYLYVPYKRVMPLISTNGISYQKLALVPLLTTKEFITFGKGFDGELDLYNSNLLKTDNVYWQGKQITVLLGDDVIDKFILDDLQVPAPYWTQEKFVRVKPEDLTLAVTGLPEIGDTITLTYNTWYMFREDNTKYNLNVTYDNDYCYVSYNKVGDDKKYELFRTYVRNYIVNTGYQFNGRLSYQNSTRFGLPFCDWYAWHTYEINYKEYGTDEWKNWTMFTVNQNVTIFEQCGFDLNGIHYLESSWYKKGDYITPFIAHYDINYVLPYGNVVINNGIATSFNNESYMMLIPEMLKDGMRVDISFTTSDTNSQGIATNALIHRNKIAYSQRTTDVYTEAKQNTEYVLQYLFVDGKLITRVIGRGYVDFEAPKEIFRTVTCIPVNVDAQEGDENYLVHGDEVNKLHALYRIKGLEEDWDKHTNTGTAVWTPVEFTHVDTLLYIQEELHDLYVVRIPLGWINDQNRNPDGLDFRKGDIIQLRIITDGEEHQSYMDVLTYSDIKFLQKIKF